MTAVRFSARTRISTLDASACLSPLAVFQHLAARGAAEGSARTARTGGSVLMESAAQGSPGGTRSLVVPAGVVRLIARGRDVSFDALSPQGARLLPALGGLSRFPSGVGAPSLPDDERLRVPTVLDAVRALANLVEDEEPKAALPPGVYGAFLTSSSTAGKICLPVPRRIVTGPGTSQTSTSSSRSIPFSLTTWPGTFTWSRALWIGRRTLSVTSGTNGSSKR